MSQQALSFSAAPGSCGALYFFRSSFKLPPLPPLVCSRPIGHDGNHQDATQQNPLHSGPPNWADEVTS